MKIEKEYFVFLISLIILFLLIPFIKYNLGGLDSYSHYFQSAYATKYPSLFFNSWAKPLFISLSFGFTHFLKYIGLKIFNIIFGFGTAVLTYFTAKELNLKKPTLAFFLTLLSPFLFWGMYSGLTDILFSFIVILGFLLFLKKKYKSSGLIFGISLLSRDEGLIIISLFILIFIFNKKIFSTIFMIITPIMFKIFSKIMSPINQWGPAKNYYSFLIKENFIQTLTNSLNSNYRKISGIFYLFFSVFIINLIYLVNPFILFGAILGTSYILSKKWTLKDPQFIIVILIGYSISVLTLLRLTMIISISGTIRYVIYLIPFFVLLCLIGLEHYDKKNTIIISSIYLLILLLSIVGLSGIYYYLIFFLTFLLFLIIPQKKWAKIFFYLTIIGSILLLIIHTGQINYDFETELGKEINEWIEQEQLFNREIRYFVITLALERNLDPYEDSSNFKYWYLVNMKDIDKLTKGSIIIYQDFITNKEHFLLLQREDLKEIKKFKNTIVYEKIA
jgi:hypothetical protein